MIIWRENIFLFVQSCACPTRIHASRLMFQLKSNRSGADFLSLLFISLHSSFGGEAVVICASSVFARSCFFLCVCVYFTIFKAIKLRKRCMQTIYCLWSIVLMSSLRINFDVFSRHFPFRNALEYTFCCCHSSKFSIYRRNERNLLTLKNMVEAFMWDSSSF